MQYWEVDTGKLLFSDHESSQALLNVGQTRDVIIAIPLVQKTRLIDENGATVGEVEGLASDFSPDGRFLTTISNKNVFVWRLDAIQLIGELRGHQRRVTNAKFSTDSRWVVTGSDSCPSG